MELTADAMIGSWRRAAQVSCKTIYPPLVTFMKNGIYAAPDSPDAGAIWHGGDWEIDQDNALRVQAAHDALLKYSVDELSADGFVLVDQDGCRINLFAGHLSRPLSLGVPARAPHPL